MKKVLIIEDEMYSALRLKRLISDIDDTTDIHGPLKSIAEVVAELSVNNDYDIIFSDIRLIDGEVFEAFRKVRPNAFVIFTTAYDEYAMQAIKNNGLDYLMKPVDFNELCTALGYGYDYDRMDEKYFILLLIGAALRSGDELKAADERVNYFIEHGAEPDEETMKTEVKIAAEGLSGELLYMKFLQGIPIVGAVGGAYDPIYIDRITRYASMKYNRRFLHDIKNKH